VVWNGSYSHAIKILNGVRQGAVLNPVLFCTYFDELIHAFESAKAEDKKRAKYANLAPSFCFVPVVVETLGALGAGAVELLYELGRRITESTTERRATEYLLQRRSVAIQRGNAASVLGTVGLAADSQKLNAVFCFFKICNIDRIASTASDDVYNRVVMLNELLQCRDCMLCLSDD